MSLITADKIASKMVGEAIRTFDYRAARAIAELGRLISSDALSQLAIAGYVCDITPPTIIRGANVKLSTLSIPALVLPICTRQDEIELTVSVRERN